MWLEIKKARNFNAVVWVLGEVNGYAQEDRRYQSGFGNGFETEASLALMQIGNATCPAPCRSAATRRKNAPTGSTPSSSAARPSRRPEPPTSAPGSTASTDGRQLGPLRQGRRRPVAHRT